MNRREVSEKMSKLQSNGMTFILTKKNNTAAIGIKLAVLKIFSSDEQNQIIEFAKSNKEIIIAILQKVSKSTEPEELKNRIVELNFNKEEAHAEYLRDNATLRHDKDLLDRLLNRHELLSRNALFIEEWKELDELHETKTRTVYNEKSIEFRKRWKVFHPSGMHQKIGYPGAPVQVVDKDYSGKITVEINLNLSKNRLLKDIKKLLIKEYDSWIDIQKNGIKETTPYCDELRGNNLDADLIDLYIKAWTLKNNGMTRRQIMNILQLNSTDTARDYCRAAKKLIKNGLPGFPPFPQKDMG